MKPNLLAVPGLVLALAVAGAVAAEDKAIGDRAIEDRAIEDRAVFVPASKIAFDDIIPGTVAFATVTGDRETGAHGTFVSVPAGQATPMHTHGAPYHAVVIDGKFENPVAGDEASNVTLGKGSYYYVPAGAKHITRCAADSPVPCLTYFYQDVAFDFAVSE